MMSDEKIGRPRRYAFEPAAGFAHPHAAYCAAALDELSQRHFDLLVDLPADVLHWVPAEGWYSIAMITAHAIQAEAGWVAQVTGVPVPADIEQPLSRWRRGQGEPATHDQLHAACRRVREEVTRERLARLEDIDAEVAAGDMAISVRGVLHHLIWHWTYHSGQTGLLRGLRGLEYRWTFDGHVTAAAEQPPA